MERCPTCRARLGAEDRVCPRCRSDLALLRRAEAGARRHCRHAVQAMQCGEMELAAGMLNAALHLKREPLPRVLSDFLCRRQALRALHFFLNGDQRRAQAELACVAALSGNQRFIQALQGFFQNGRPDGKG